MCDATAQLLVAIDGPSGTGKSTVARAVAERLGVNYLDTGAMYRVATLWAQRQGIDLTDEEAVINATAGLPMDITEDPRSTAVILDGKDVSADIRSESVTSAVSTIAAIPQVRENLVALQRQLATTSGRCVVEGRDIGTVVLPECPLKVFLTASAEIRARRRYNQDLAAGREADYDTILAAINRRDTLDSSRAASPLRPADDARLLDTSELDVDAVINRILDFVTEVYGTTASASDNTNLLPPPAVGSAHGDADAALNKALADHEDVIAEAIARAETGELGDNVDWQEIEEAFAALSGEVDENEPLPTVAIVGRPNVGKSTMVNRFIGRREAVVEDFPGVTRDRISYLADWAGQKFWVQDTGGWDPDAKGMHAAIARQAEVAMATADVILMVVDTTVGITSTDEVMARKLQRAEQPVVLVANKFESDAQLGDVAEFWSLGLDYPYPVSALHGRGNADVMDEVVRLFPEQPRAAALPSGPRRVALVGKPNVGKSSLMNKISGEERAVVSEIAGTTVDPVDTLVQLNETVWRFVDTAGLRKKVRQVQGHEYYASLRTRAAIDSAEVCVFLIDSSEPITEQDQRVLRMILDSGRALVLAFNKWDKMDEDRRELLEREIDLQLAHVPWARRINISAKTGRALQRLEPAMLDALDSWDKRIPTSKLNTWLRGVLQQTPPPMRGGRLPRVLFATQASTKPPVFVLFTTHFLEHGYRRFLERKLREEFGFEGTPVRIAVRVREKRRRK